MAVKHLLLLAYGATKDEERLTSHAKRQAQKLGAWFQEQNLAPDTTLSAPEAPALTSAEKALKAGGLNAQDIIVDPRLRPDEETAAFDALTDRAARRMLCVGSPKTLAALLRRLASAQAMPAPGSLTHLSFAAGDLAAGHARLEAVVAADDLPDGFPYPGTGGTERRARPAYYYTQSAALPYRIHEGRLEVLLITSSSGRKWGIPKGICEPGLTTRESAAKEALEEAGIRGEMHPHRIATYEQPKWGALCSVAVYPMRVTDILQDSEREEPHRRRLWLSPIEAADRVSHPALEQIIRAFVEP